MTSYPKFDELIGNLEEASDQLIDLIRVAETIKQLSQQQDTILKEFASGGRQIDQAATDLRQAQREMVSTINVGFDVILLENEKALSSIQKDISSSITIVGHEGHTYRNEHKKWIENIEQHLIRFNKIQQIGLDNLRSETGKVSQLEQHVMVLLDKNKSQFQLSLLAIDQATVEVKNSTKSNKETEEVLTEMLKVKLAELKQKNENALIGIKLTIAEGSEKIQKKLDNDRNQSADAAENLTIVVKQSRDDNRQFYGDSERLLRIKLNENKSEIRQLIEDERNRIREIVSQRAEETENHIYSQLKSEFDSVVKQQKKLQIVLWAIGVVLVGLMSVVIITDTWSQLQKSQYKAVVVRPSHH